MQGEPAAPLTSSLKGSSGVQPEVACRLGSSIIKAASAPSKEKASAGASDLQVKLFMSVSVLRLEASFSEDSEPVVHTAQVRSMKLGETGNERADSEPAWAPVTFFCA